MTPFSDVLDGAFRPMLASSDTPPAIAKLLQRFIAGYREFERTGETPTPAYLAMRQLFCVTNGEFNDIVHRLLQDTQGGPPRPVASSGVLGTLDEVRLAAVVERIGSQGYHVFEQRLDPALCDSLRALALETPCLVSGGDGAVTPSAPVPYRSERPIANRYDLPEVAPAAHPGVQALLLDDSIRAVAAAYLGCRPVLDFVSMWWLASFSQSPKALSSAAQLYHFDMDRLKFLKFFVYLTDVDTRTSPHCYVRGSRHRKPEALLRDGRFTDEEIAGQYPAEDLVEIVAPAGSIFAVDTRGFHKGKVMESGERLVLQLEFASSLFGQNYGRIGLPAEACLPAFAAFLRDQPELAGRYDLVQAPKKSAASQ
jgi:hypothetical protein